jgi:2-methylcitrate dehydratase PrpD
VIDKAKACLLHGLAVGVVGRATPFGDLAERATAPAEGGRARAFTSGRRLPAGYAAFVNSVLFQSQAQDDTHGTTHLGTAVIPATIALGEETGATGAMLLSSIVAGYESGAALASQLTSYSTPPFRASIYAYIAAAAGCARVLELDETRTASAIAFASAFAGGTTASLGEATQEWHFQYAVAAQSGVLAARLAQAGAIGSTRALEGSGGFLEAFARAGTHEGNIVEHLGRRWELLNVMLKPYPICAFNQAPALLAARISATEGLKPSDIADVVVELNAREAAYPGMSARGPFEDSGQTLVSAPFCVALALVDRDITYEGLRRFDDEDVLSIVERTQVIAQEERPPKTARLIVSTTDGRCLSEDLEHPAREFAWTFAEAQAQARRLLKASHLSSGQVESLLAVIDNATELQDVSEIVDCIVPEVAP